MRIFAACRGASGLALVPRPLENTPDVARIAADPALKARLLAYVRDNLRRSTLASSRCRTISSP